MFDELRELAAAIREHAPAVVEHVADIRREFVRLVAAVEQIAETLEPPVRACAMCGAPNMRHAETCPYHKRARHDRP